MAATADGHGYWLVASDGGIFTFGDAGFFGSTAGCRFNDRSSEWRRPPTAMGTGWLPPTAASLLRRRRLFRIDGRSTDKLRNNKPIVGMAVAAAGAGYWEVASDGGIFSLGDAPFHGSVPELPPPGPPRIALYGDSLASEAGQDFAVLAADAGASVRVRTFPGSATCDFLSSMAADAEEWQPTAAGPGLLGGQLHAVHGG